MSNHPHCLQSSKIKVIIFDSEMWFYAFDVICLKMHLKIMDTFCFYLFLVCHQQNLKRSTPNLSFIADDAIFMGWYTRSGKKRTLCTMYMMFGRVLCGKVALSGIYPISWFVDIALCNQCYFHWMKCNFVSIRWLVTDYIQFPPTSYVIAYELFKNIVDVLNTFYLKYSH